MIALVGAVLGGCIMLLQGNGEGGTALIIIGLEEAWRNGTKETKEKES